MMKSRYQQIKDAEQLSKLLRQPDRIVRRYAFHSVDFTTETDLALSHVYCNCLFLSCKLPMGLKRRSKDSLFLPNMGMLFRFPSHLYSPEELYEGYSPDCPESYDDCYDGCVYRHYLSRGKHASDVKETLARALHDHSVSDSLQEFLTEFDMHRRVGVMGGHGLSRCDKVYENVAHLSKRLTEKGFLMITGGGPGAMEATHLGAWMAGYTEAEFQQALALMRTAPKFTDNGWLRTAWQVHNTYPNKNYKSLGIPTWLYGHEPSTPLATHIAKYFDNSIREDGILTIASGGVIYTPGSAGTLQEVFQEAVQNHYLSFGYASPMIFMGREFWTEQVPIWPLLQHLVNNGTYKNLILCLTEDEDEIERTLSGK